MAAPAPRPIGQNSPSVTKTVMEGEVVSVTTTTPAPQSRAVLLPKSSKPRSVTWQPPEGLMPEEAEAVINAAEKWRDRLLLRCMWVTGARVSEVLGMTPAGIQVRTRELILPNLKNPSRLFKRVPLPASQGDLLAELLEYVREKAIPPDQPIFKLSRKQVWVITKKASEAANIKVLALRSSKDGARGEPAPIHPHVFRHGRVRQWVRHTKSLPLAQKLAGWSKLQMAYLSVGDEEARQLVAEVPE